jgi:hypothetical protein
MTRYEAKVALAIAMMPYMNHSVCSKIMKTIELVL